MFALWRRMPRSIWSSAAGITRSRLRSRLWTAWCRWTPRGSRARARDLVSLAPALGLALARPRATISPSTSNQTSAATSLPLPAGPLERSAGRAAAAGRCWTSRSTTTRQRTPAATPGGSSRDVFGRTPPVSTQPLLALPDGRGRRGRRDPRRGSQPTARRGSCQRWPSHQAVGAEAICRRRSDGGRCRRRNDRRNRLSGRSPAHR